MRRPRKLKLSFSKLPVGSQAVSRLHLLVCSFHVHFVCYVITAAKNRAFSNGSVLSPKEEIRCVSFWQRLGRWESALLAWLDGFWQVSVYNEARYFEPNKHSLYSLNKIVRTKGNDGTNPPDVYRKITDQIATALGQGVRP
jgi:hypothetical protein